MVNSDHSPALSVGVAWFESEPESWAQSAENAGVTEILTSANTFILYEYFT